MPARAPTQANSDLIVGTEARSNARSSSEEQKQGQAAKDEREHV